MEDHFLIRHSHFYSECCINTPSLFQPFHFPQSRLILFFVWCDIRLSMVTHTWNLCSVLTHPKCTHTVVSTHTHSSEHAPGAVGNHLCCGTWGAVGGSVSCSRAPRHGIEGVESAVHSLPPLTIPAGPRLKLTTFQLRVRLSNH